MSRLVEPFLAPGSLAGREQPVLAAAGDLHLRPWNHGDVDVVVAAYRDPAIRTWNLRSLDEAEADEWIRSWSTTWEAETDACWAIAGADDEVVGRIALRRIFLEGGLAEVAYWVLPHARQRGVASRATEALIGWAFGDLGLHRLELHHSVRNGPSCGVARRAGFTLEGTMRSAHLHQNGWHDMHLHALVDRTGQPSGIS